MPTFIQKTGSKGRDSDIAYCHSCYRMFCLRNNWQRRGVLPLSQTEKQQPYSARLQRRFLWLKGESQPSNKLSSSDASYTMPNLQIKNSLNWNFLNSKLEKSNPTYGTDAMHKCINTFNAKVLTVKTFLFHSKSIALQCSHQSPRLNDFESFDQELRRQNLHLKIKQAQVLNSE